MNLLNNPYMMNNYVMMHFLFVLNDFTLNRQLICLNVKKMIVAQRYLVCMKIISENVVLKMNFDAMSSLKKVISFDVL